MTSDTLEIRTLRVVADVLEDIVDCLKRGALDELDGHRELLRRGTDVLLQLAPRLQYDDPTVAEAFASAAANGDPAGAEVLARIVFAEQEIERLV